MSKFKSQETNERREIEHRIDRLDRAIKTGKIEKAKAFKDLNVSENKLSHRILSLKEKKERLEKDIEVAEKQKLHIAKQRKKLGYEHEVEVTEHAMLRYIERYMEVNMDEVWNNVLKLPKKDVTRYGNTIVTVYPEDDVVDSDQII